MKSITEGLNEIKDAFLGLTGCGIGASPHFKHTTVLKRLCASPPETDGVALADAFLIRVEQNWRAGHGKHNTLPSRGNWRFTKAGKITQRNPSPEVTFERDLVRLGGETWANQIPTASGLLGPHLDKRLAIDLVEKRGAGEFELIELKIDSDTPLFAAMEILEYATIYAFSRLHADALGYGPGISDLL